MWLEGTGIGELASELDAEAANYRMKWESRAPRSDQEDDRDQESSVNSQQVSWISLSRGQTFVSRTSTRYYTYRSVRR